MATDDPKTVEELTAALMQLQAEVKELRALALSSALDGSRTEPPAVADDGMLRTKGLIIVDDQDRPRAQVVVSADGPLLEMLSEDGTTRVRLCGQDASCLGLFGTDGQPRITMHTQNPQPVPIEGDGSWAMLKAATSVGVGPGIAVWDDHGPRAVLTVVAEGPALLLSGPEEHLGSSLLLQVNAEGPAMAFHDHASIPRLGLGMRPSMGPFLTFLDGVGNARLVLQEEGDHASMTLFDGDEGPLSRWVGTARGHLGQLVFYDPEGALSLTLGVAGNESGLTELGLTDEAASG